MLTQRRRARGGGVPRPVAACRLLRASLKVRRDRRRTAVSELSGGTSAVTRLLPFSGSTGTAVVPWTAKMLTYCSSVVSFGNLWNFLIAEKPTLAVTVNESSSLTFVFRMTHSSSPSERLVAIRFSTATSIAAMYFFLSRGTAGEYPSSDH